MNQIPIDIPCSSDSLSFSSRSIIFRFLVHGKCFCSVFRGNIVPGLVTKLYQHSLLRVCLNNLVFNFSAVDHTAHYAGLLLKWISVLKLNTSFKEHKYFLVKFTVWSWLFNSLTGGNVLYKISETLMIIWLYIATDDYYLGQK